MDATTIIECLHSFCRSCIVKYLQTSFHCPVCDVEVHKTKPLLHIRPDRPLQDIVNKLVPGLVYDELNRRTEFYEKTEKAKNDDNTDETETETSTETQTKSNCKSGAEVKMEDPICITLEYYRRKRNWNERQIFPTRYLRCPSAVTVNVLKKFLVMKFAIPSTHQAELIRSDELLSDSLTMKEVSQIYGLYTKSFLDLQYSFLDVFNNDSKNSNNKVDEIPLKKLKTCRDEWIFKKEKEECVIIKKEPSAVEKKENLPEQSDCTSNEQLNQNDSSTTFPETPPSFELDPSEQETV